MAGYDWVKRGMSQRSSEENKPHCFRFRGHTKEIFLGWNISENKFAGDCREVSKLLFGAVCLQSYTQNLPVSSVFCTDTSTHRMRRHTVSSEMIIFSVFLSLSDENQKILLTCPVARESVVHLVTSEHAAVRRECLALLYLFSQTPRGRSLAIDNLNLQT